MPTDDTDHTSRAGHPKGWSWRDRARGSIVRAAVLDPGTEPLDGIEAFPTAYVPDRLLVSDGGDPGRGAWRILAASRRAGAPAGRARPDPGRNRLSAAPRGADPPGGSHPPATEAPGPGDPPPGGFPRLRGPARNARGPLARVLC